jgi:hypothetical protein
MTYTGRWLALWSLVVSVGAFGLFTPGLAWALDPPKGPVVLTVSGKIGNTNKTGAAELDLAALKALPQHSFVTDTPWDKRPVKFSGPRLRDVLALVKAGGTELKAVAVNDYAVTVPVADARDFDVVVALLMNDRDIPARTKGPLFLIYPFSAQPALNAKVYHERSIWQLKSVVVQ